MPLCIRERIILNLGPYWTLPGVWWLKLSDTQIIFLTPIFGIELYNWAMDTLTERLKRGWRFSWKRAPFKEGDPLYLRSRERLDYRWIR